MMNQLFVGVGCALAVAGIAAYNEYKTPDPIIEGVEILEIKPYHNRVDVRLAWVTTKDCKFEALTTVQATPGDRDATRIAIQRYLPPRGPRGKGRQEMTGFWTFYRPSGPAQLPVVVFEAWHDCPGAGLVMSPMLSVPFDEFFPPA